MTGYVEATPTVVNPTLLAVGRRFAAARTAADLSQNAVANAVGLTRSSIANFEGGRQDIPLSKVINMCDAVGASVGDIVAGWPTVNPLEQFSALAARADGLMAEMDAMRDRARVQDREINRLARMVDMQRTAGRAT